MGGYTIIPMLCVIYSKVGEFGQYRYKKEGSEKILAL